MTDNLRDRIAAVLKTASERRGIYRIADFDYPFLADAVIEALNLRTDQVGTLTRYVTKWISEVNDGR